MGKAKEAGIIVGGIFAAFTIAVIVIGASSGEPDISPPQTAAANPEIAPKVGTRNNPAGMNTTLTVNNIDFIITDVRTDSTIWFEGADGVFLIVSMTVENKGQQTEEIYGSDFRLIDDQSRTFESSSQTIMLKNGLSFIGVLQPSLPKNTEVAFDVVPDQPYVLEIDAGTFRENGYVALEY